MKPPLVVIGSRTSDISVDIDLSELYRLHPNSREKIRFRGNDPTIRKNQQIAARIASGKFIIFNINIDLSEDDPKEKVEFSLDDDRYYKLEGGGKYTLATQPTQVSKIDAHADALELVCEDRSWGGGGINLAKTCRSLSSESTTPITYVDASPHISTLRWFKSFCAKRRDFMTSIHESTKEQYKTDMFYLAHLVGIMRNLKLDPDLESVADAINEHLAQTGDLIARWLEEVGERGYRSISQLLSIIDPLENVELFLAQQGIETTMLRHESAPEQINLVFTSFRDSSRKISDKIIFRGKQQQLDQDIGEAAYKLLDREFPEPGAVVLNTVYDENLFFAALKWIKDVQRKQLDAIDTQKPAVSKQDSAVAKQRVFPVIVAFTERNRQHLEKLKPLQKICKELHNLYLVFNEAEFADYAANDREAQADEFKSNIKAGMRPEIRRLGQFFKQCDQTTPLTTTKIFVTLGTLGSIGYVLNHYRYSGPFSVPEKTIFSTNGCGDAYAAAVALLAYHKHNHEFDGGSPGYLLSDKKEQADVELMMQLGTAAAYSKATSPTGRVTCRDVLSLVQNSYLPTGEPAEVTSFDEGPVAQPPHAVIRSDVEMLQNILDA